MRTRSQSTYKSKVSRCYPFAKPMASKRLTKKCIKLLQLVLKCKNSVIKGTEKVRKYILKGHYDKFAIVLLAGDVRPRFDLRGCLPDICEQNDRPYVYVPSADDLGEVLSNYRRNEAVLIKFRSKYRVRYNKVHYSILELLEDCKRKRGNISLDMHRYKYFRFLYYMSRGQY